MKILYITSSFEKKGSASIRNVALVNGLAECTDTKVDVLTQLWPETMLDKDLIGMISKKVRIYRDPVRAIQYYFTKIKSTSDLAPKRNIRIISFIKDTAKYLYYFPDIDKEWMKHFNVSLVLDFKGYDLIISSSDTKTAHFVAYKIIKQHPDIQWFQIWGDPWKDDKGTTGIRRIVAAYFEKFLLVKGQQIFYTSVPTLDIMRKRFPVLSNKLHPIKRAYLREIPSQQNDNEEYIFSYIGSIYYGRSIEPLMNAIKNYNHKYKKKIRLRIYGTYGDKEKKDCARFNFVELCGFVTYSRVLEIMAKSSVLVYLCNSEDSHQIPGKLFDYFGTDKPILALTNRSDNAVADFIRSTKRCILQKNEVEKIDLKVVIKSVQEGSYSVVKEYAANKVAKELLDYIGGVK